MTRAFSPSTARNREPILAVLQRVLAAGGSVLEVASGSGEHAVFVARALPLLTWQPSDPDAQSRASIAAWIAQERLQNVLPPRDIDVRAPEWGVAGPFDAIVAINMIHISPWEATLGLFAGAARLVREGGVLFLYGPYKRDGHHTAQSNESFEEWLKARDPAFGVRDMDDVMGVAEGNGFVLKRNRCDARQQFFPGYSPKV